MKIALLLLALVLATTSAAKLAAAEAERPNILYFYVDDMGWGSIGPNGQAARKAKNLPYVRTPNLDRLAAQGVNFTRGYGCHVCSPARSSQQSGFHQGQTFADRNDPNNAKKAMRADDILMGDALSAAGYVTGYWGKWGYGGSKSQINPVIENVQSLPTSHGYQYVLAELHHVRAHTFFQPTLWSAPAPPNAVGGLELVANSMVRYRNKADYPNTPALQDHADYPKTAYCDDAYAFAALDFVRTQGTNYNTSGQPFFGLLAVQIPHAPFGEIVKLPEWDKAYAKDRRFASLSDQTRQWAAMVTRIDAHFGNILAALEDPNNDGEAPPDVNIYLHHEMAQTPIYPSKLFFFCEKAAERGGATPICRSDVLYERLCDKRPEFAKQCEAEGLRYTNVMPPQSDLASGMGRSWQSTFSAETREDAEDRLRGLGYSWEWLPDGCLRATTPTLSAVRQLDSYRKSFFNQLIAAFQGWKDSRNDPSKSITFGDGSPLDPEDVAVAVRLADELSFDIPWQQGDVALVDNFVVMHGRRTFEGTRKVLASLVATEK